MGRHAAHRDAGDGNALFSAANYEVAGEASNRPLSAVPATTEIAMPNTDAGSSAAMTYCRSNPDVGQLSREPRRSFHSKKIPRPASANKVKDIALTRW